MSRRSIEDMSTNVVAIVPNVRPEPPDELTPEQAKEWRKIVNRMPVDMVGAEIHPLLTQSHRQRARRHSLVEGCKLRPFRAPRVGDNRADVGRRRTGHGAVGHQQTRASLLREVFLVGGVAAGGCARGALDVLVPVAQERHIVERRWEQGVRPIGAEIGFAISHGKPPGCTQEEALPLAGFRVLCLQAPFFGAR
jgi:hypothetical protein